MEHQTMLDRLLLNENRIEEMANGLRQVAILPDPIGEIKNMSVRPNGLQIGQQSMPLGVIGIIYEARPNVTCDAAGLCLKSGDFLNKIKKQNEKLPFQITFHS
ncbi:hypothetical protein ACFQDF_28120 [Ectobacillus funiculus]